MAINSIGNFHFLRLDPQPPGTQLHVISTTRPGVNGHEFWTLGVKHQPPSIHETMVDVADAAAAYATYGQYIQLKQSLQQVRWNGILLPLKYAIIDILGPPTITPMLLGVGGLVGGQALLRVRWAIQAWVDPGQEPIGTGT